MNTFVKLGELQEAHRKALPAQSWVPIGAEARGKLRVFKNILIAPQTKIEAAINSAAFEATSRDFVFKKAKGRVRALKKLDALLAPAILQGTHDDPPMACWAWLQAGGRF
jgi:hypothetical protein